jgi:hypothetical protein
MIKAYIIPQLRAIQIDNEISLRLTSEIPTEPGSDPLGGTSNGTNSEWDRVSLGPDNDIYGTGMWNN